jgi:hypothetical protein
MILINSETLLFEKKYLLVDSSFKTIWTKNTKMMISNGPSPSGGPY